MASAPNIKEIFAFTWRIENFSLCPQQSGECLESPSFVVDIFSKTEWRLLLYPREQKYFMECVLERIGNWTESVTIGYSFSAISVNQGKDVNLKREEFTFRKDDYWGFSDLFHRDDVFSKTKGLLPNDTLTIKCRIWRSWKECAPTQPVVLDSWKPTEPSKNDRCSAVTRIRAKSKLVLWAIDSFSGLRVKEAVFETVESDMEDEPLFDMKFYLREKFETNITIRRRYKSAENKSLFVRGKIKVIGGCQKIRQQAEHEYFYVGGKKDEVWRFPAFIKIEDLRDSYYFYYTGDVLYLCCELSYSAPSEERCLKTKSSNYHVYPYRNRHFNCPRNDFRRLYRSAKFSDAILRAGTKTFKIHKNILAARSDVFSKMFETNAQEQNSDKEVIVNFDPITVDRFLTFMYTDALENLRQEDAAKLYAIADEYSVVPLKLLCCGNMMSVLSVSSVSEVLLLADDYKDEDLFEAARYFIHANANEVLSSENWKGLMKRNSRLALQLMHEVFIKKFSV